MCEFDVVGRILELCKKKNWSYYRLAKESGIPYSTLNTMILKTNIPSVPTLMKLCRGFGITAAQFFAEEGESTDLSMDQRQCLKLWDSLDQYGRDLALAYMRGVADRQGK